MMVPFKFFIKFCHRDLRLFVAGQDQFQAVNACAMGYFRIFRKCRSITVDFCRRRRMTIQIQQCITAIGKGTFIAIY
jgi:hypothetical protein